MRWQRRRRGRIVSSMTNRQRNETAMRKGEAQFRTLLDHILDGVAVVADGKMVYVNPTVSEMFGYDEAELLGAEPSALVTSPDRERLREAGDGLTNDVVGRFATEFEAVRKDETTFPMQVLSQRIDLDGQPASLSQLRDLTSQRAQETALREAEAKYRTLVEHSLAGVAIIQDRRFRYANPKLAEILGYTQRELLALPSVLDVVHEDDRAIVQEKYRQRLDGDLQKAHYTARVRRKEGQVIDVEINGCVTTYSGGKAIIGTMLDVTERRRPTANSATVKSAFGPCSKSPRSES